MAEKFGEEQVLLWRRSYDVRPPALALDDPRVVRNDPRYRGVDPDRAFYVLSIGDIADDAVSSLSLPALPPFEIESEAT